MTTETSKYPIPGISYEAFTRAAALAETDTRIGRSLDTKGIDLVTLRIVNAELFFEAASPTLLVSALIKTLEAQESIINELQSQVDTLRPGGSDHG